MRPKVVAISMRRARVKYLLKWNSFSNSVNCLLVKLVRPRLLLLAVEVPLLLPLGLLLWLLLGAAALLLLLLLPLPLLRAPFETLGLETMLGREDPL